MRRTLALLLLAGCAGGADPGRERQAHAAWLAGEKALREKKAADAVAHYTLALELSTGFPQAFLGRARAHEALGSAAAQADFDRAVEAGPEEKKSIYLYHRARHAQRGKRHDKAVEDFSRAIVLLETWPEPNYPAVSRLHRGLSLLELNRPEEALRDFDAVLARHPDPVTREEAEALRAQALDRR